MKENSISGVYKLKLFVSRGWGKVPLWKFKVSTYMVATR